MKILVLNRVAAPVEGGMNQYVLDVCARLRAAGVQVGLVHARLPASRFHGTGYVFDHLGRNTPGDSEVFYRFEAILEDFQPDLVQIHGVNNPALVGWTAGRLPTVQFVHNHAAYCSGVDMTWRRPRRLCRRPHGPLCVLCHAVCGCSAEDPVRSLIRYRAVGAQLASLRRVHGIQVAGASIRDNLVRNGLDPARIEVLPPYAPAPVAERRPLATGRRMVLHVGGLLQKKGVWLMLNGLDRLPGDVELVFAGGGELEGELRAAVRRRGLGGRVRVMGELDPAEWSALLHQATLVVMPSRWNEPVGLSGLQALAHGKPVVAFDSGGVSGWLGDGAHGLLVPFNDKRAFLTAVRSLLDDPARMAAMGRSGARRWGDEFRPERHIERLTAYYHRILDDARGKAGPPPAPEAPRCGD